MKVLVTGAAGFLAGHVARWLDANGHDVTVFDLNAVDGFRSLQGDLRDLEAVRSATRGQEAVCHLGAIGDVYLAAEEPGLAAGVNVVGSSNIGVAAAEQGARVAYASTWEVYGEPQYEPLDEAHPCEPDHPYNITKLAGERMLMAAGLLNDLDVVGLRLGTAYGRGLRPNSVFKLFIDRARKGEAITIHGDGSQGRQFTHAEDISRAFELAITNQTATGCFNIVSPESITVRQLAEMIAERFPTKVEFGEPRPGDVPPAMVSWQRAKDELGWSAEVSFDKGLDDLVAEALESD